MSAQHRAELLKADAIMRRLSARAVFWELDDGVCVGDNTDPDDPESPTEFAVTTGQDDGIEKFVPADGLVIAIGQVRALKRARKEEP